MMSREWSSRKAKRYDFAPPISGPCSVSYADPAVMPTIAEERRQRLAQAFACSA